MSDVKSMAHVEKFSHLTIPMLWFEIGLQELPDRLQKRFSLYLNILPMVEKAGLYGSLILGAILSIFAVTQVALRTSKTIASQRCHQKFNRNLVYTPCEEKLIDLHQMKKMPQVIKVDEFNNKSDDESNDNDCGNVISRNQYELEDDDAISDIDYNEIVDEESTSSSTEPVCKFIFTLYPLKPSSNLLHSLKTLPKSILNLFYKPRHWSATAIEIER